MDARNTGSINTADTIRDIKRWFRLSMNGIVSTSMRERGLAYKLNFGLTRPMLKRIAAKYTPDKAVAEALWSDIAVRESRLLAPMLCPLETFSANDARLWVSTIAHWEEADYCCMELFSKIASAQLLVSEWIDDSRPMVQYAGFQLLNRLLIQSVGLEIELSIVLSKAVEILTSASDLTLSAVVINTLKRIIRHGGTQAHTVIDYFRSKSDSSNKSVQYIYNELQAEYESFVTD